MARVLSRTLTVITVLVIIAFGVVIVVNSLTEGELAFLTVPLLVALGVLVVIRLVSLAGQSKSRVLAPIFGAGSVQSRAFGFPPITFHAEESNVNQSTTGVDGSPQDETDRDPRTEGDQRS